jgi:Protein of unknown function (DUF3025)
LAPGVADIDWAAPWLAPWCDVGAPLAGAIAAGADTTTVLNQAGGSPVRFVPHTQLTDGVPYERFIAQGSGVPTRVGLHDFFNALCWMHFPLAKQQLNALQAGEIARAGIQAVRGPVRDAITVFDENAALMQAPDVVWAALAERQWQRLFIELRPRWSEVRLVLFGHALLEKLVSPYKSITAHVWRIDSAIDFDDFYAPAGRTTLDAWLARDLTRTKLAAKPFVPLPVLGVPGWWPGNGAVAYVSDASVFRPLRTVGAKNPN